MKMKICKLTCLALCLLILASCLLSCSDAVKLNRMEEAERAFALYTLVNETMDEADSYTMNLEADFSLTYSGVTVTAKAEGSIQESGMQGENYVYYSETNTTVNVANEKMQITSIEGYTDEKMYRYEKNEESEQKLWSPISAADYRTHQKAMNDGFDFDITADNCTPLSCVQNEDKTWTVTFAKFDQDAMTQFISLLDGLEDMLSDEQKL